MADWNLWHGCRRWSEGCLHCYVYRTDSRYGRDASQVERTAAFDLPVRRKRGGGYVVPSGERMYTCFTSDFFLEEADPWRPAAWRMMRQRPDLEFFFVTKRIHRFWQGLPADWGEGYPNVCIGCTVENQRRAQERLGLFRSLPIRRKTILCEPLLERLDLRPWLGDWVEEVIVGGESGPEARLCDYDWVLDLRRQCKKAGVSFFFKQTGAHFRKDGRVYHIPRSQQHDQARRAGIDWLAPGREPRAPDHPTPPQQLSFSQLLDTPPESDETS